MEGQKDDASCRQPKRGLPEFANDNPGVLAPFIDGPHKCAGRWDFCVHARRKRQATRLTKPAKLAGEWGSSLLNSDTVSFMAYVSLDFFEKREASEWSIYS